MLHAILGNKSGRINVGGQSVPVRDIYKGLEDMITAAVVSRLPYLSPSIRQALFSLCLPESNKDFSYLRSVEFWPRLESNYQNQVEPDVVALFDWGTLLIEAKRPLDGAQCVDQWFREVDALANDDTYPGEIVFLALGGDSTTNRQFLSELSLKLQQQAYSICESHELCWLALARFVAQVLETENIGASDIAILTDIGLALELYGVNSHPTLETLPKYGLSLKDSLEKLAPWKPENIWQAMVLDKPIQAGRISKWMMDN